MDGGFIKAEKVADQEIQVYEFDNYRTYLKAFYQWKKGERKSFSFRAFSRAAGFSSPNFLQLVMEGKRNLTHESIHRFCKALKLNRDESEFFRNLVLLNQAKTQEEKQTHAEALIRSRMHRKLRPLAKAQYEYWQQWYNLVIREMVRLQSFRNDPEWIAKVLTPAITPKEAEEALKHLEILGLIQKNSDGQWLQTEGNISSGDEIVSTSVAQFHRDMIQRGREAIDRFHSHERQVSSITFELSMEGVAKVRRMVDQFRKELVAVASQETKPQNIYQMNFQFFPLTQIPGEDENP